MFPDNDCKSNKHCGKKQYKSPEVIDHKPQFCAKSNDIWGLGVIIFMLTVGHPPWIAAKSTDVVFQYIMDGCICEVLQSWNVLHYFNEESISLLTSIFKYENDRISLFEIKQRFSLFV